MKQQTVHVACVLTAEEYQRFKALCEKNNTYPSAAIREAVMAWMERNEKDGMANA